MLFPDITNTWRDNGIDSFALRSGLARLAVTGFATREYCAPIHPDPNDSKWTAGWRCWKGDGYSETEYKFIYSLFQHASSSQPGIIVDQPKGAIMIWQGKNHLHGSSIDTNAPVGNHGGMVQADTGMVEK
jgi:hypothetical protein